MGELLEPEGEGPSEAAIVSDGAAVGIALERARSRRGRGADEVADRFLAAQEALIADQRRHLHEQFRHMGLKLWSERLRLGLQSLAAAGGVAILVALLAIVWDASRAKGVVIDAFSVPPALVQQGLTGEAVARRLMDDLSALAETATPEQQASVVAGWSKGLSVEIPETGLSLGELDKWLREKLGHETHISGELIVPPDGPVTLVARDGEHGLPVLSGGEPQIADLIEKTAQAVYARQQPVGYWQYLSHQGRWDEALAFAEPLTHSPDPKQRVFAYTIIGNLAQYKFGAVARAEAYRQALAIDPHANFPLGNLADVVGSWGHAEEALSLKRRALAAATDHNGPDTSAGAIRQRRTQLEGWLAEDLGDYATAARISRGLSQETLMAMTTAGNPYSGVYAGLLAQLHDLSGARAAIAAYLKAGPAIGVPVRRAEVNIRLEAGDWAGILVMMDDASAALQAQPDRGVTIMTPHIWKSVALAHLGRVAEAHAVIDATPLDCQPCVTARGQVAAVEGDAVRADHWFSEAVRMAPSLPFAGVEWGRSLLARGQADRAAAQADRAHSASPRFADAAELWGEALLAKGDARSAAARFAEAAALAPRWGRLRLKWGEALARLGKTSSARIQLRSAAALDLTPVERAELAGLRL